jgi:hypothetical protein
MTDSQAFVNISASTGSFQLNGGNYAVTVIKHQVPPPHPQGTIKLQMLDSSKGGGAYVSVSSRTDFMATGSATLQLRGGSYRFTVDSASAGMATVTPA